MSRRYAQRAQPCPTGHKRAYPTQGNADAALERILTQKEPAPFGELPVRSYRCRCGSWHLTHMELHPPRAIETAEPTA